MSEPYWPIIDDPDFWANKEPEDDLPIECDECGAAFVVETDSFKCPICGHENHQDEGDE